MSYSSNVANFYPPHLRLAPPLRGDPVSVIGIMLPWAHPSPQPKRHLDGVFAGLTTVTNRPTDHAILGL